MAAFGAPELRPEGIVYPFDLKPLNKPR